MNNEKETVGPKTNQNHVSNLTKWNAGQVPKHHQTTRAFNPYRVSEPSE